jgi:hypothetical protein
MRGVIEPMPLNSFHKWPFMKGFSGLWRKMDSGFHNPLSKSESSKGRF